MTIYEIIRVIITATEDSGKTQVPLLHCLSIEGRYGDGPTFTSRLSSLPAVIAIFSRDTNLFAREKCL